MTEPLAKRVKRLAGWLDRVVDESDMDYESIIEKLRLKLNRLAQYKAIRERTPDIDAGPRAEVMKFAWLAAARFYGIDPKLMMTRERTRTVSTARQIAIYVQRTVTKNSYPAIGRFWGFDHSSLLYAMDNVATRADEERTVCKALDYVLEETRRFENGGYGIPGDERNVDVEVMQ